MTESNRYTGPEAFVTASEDAPDFWRNGILWSILISADETMGLFTMIEQLMPEGGGPPPHIHERSHECFYIQEGEITFQVDTELISASEGDAVWIPPNTPHAFRIESPSARALNMYTPGGFDDNIRMLGTPATERRLPPPDAVREADSEREEEFRQRIRDLHTQSQVNVPNLLATEDEEEESHE
ncbi:quercetin 2,3-dioxygenase [Haladaptatus sp. AB643]|uniref:quercetin 2,3-dioxygenase n=1 Tax=Haladaptatus sp. AB643 TaxID=2934174 RepID=UPI00209C5B4C|nr:quercetin 2,3-dioxygenase [Haladaptatus sp. AB643]MCO8244131.1 quercetin 2,3-dioxygenase [Haladaptatus sp. AB643]